MGGMSQDRIVAHGQVYVTATRGAAELGDDINAALIRGCAHRELAEVAVSAPWYVAQPELDHLPRDEDWTAIGVRGA
jgi:hypothetical protein